MNKQIRRSQIVEKCIINNVRSVLDIGCAEGFTTSFIANEYRLVVAIELNFNYLRIAKEKVGRAFFINGSIDFLPFRDSYFDAVCILEVLEHLPTELQLKGLQEASRTLSSKGTLVISTPYKEQIVYTECIHCRKDTPLYGHLHVLDEDKITSLLPNKLFNLNEKYNMPHLWIISCRDIFALLPLQLWLNINNMLGRLGRMNIQKGYWMILKYVKS